MHTILSPYLRLMRLHQPTGIWLLLWPCWWSLAMASEGLPTLKLLVLFSAGAILMRSAGCIINDIIDRNIDRQVERTRMRPLASGEISVFKALLLLALLLAGGAFIAFELGQAVMLWASLALIPVTIYPLVKRISWWPQLFLGFTFNLGALIAWVAVRGTIEAPAILLYGGAIFWTLGYDTIYAHQDTFDDARIGVKSSALRLGEQSLRTIGLFYLMAIVCWTGAGWFAGQEIGYFVMLLFAELKLGEQVCNVELDHPESCRYFFASNAQFGWIMFAGCVLA